MQVKMSVFKTSASVFDFMLIHIPKCIESLSGTLLFGRFRFIYFLVEKVSECNCHIDPLLNGRIEP